MDPQSRIELLSLFTKLQNQGKTILIATHRLDEIAQITDTLSVMKSGKVLLTSETYKLLLDNKILDEAGLFAPLIVRIHQKLKDNGWPIDHCICLTSEALTTFLKELTQ